MNIHYHSWKAFTECPRKFYYEYVKKATSTVQINDYFKLYGLLVEKFFELFCNNWRYKTPYMPPEEIRYKMKPLYEKIIETSTVLWGDPGCKLNADEIFEEAYNDIFTIMESMNQNYFLNTKSEVSIELKLKNRHRLTGRLDFLHKDAVCDSYSIIDGKGSMKMGKNVDVNQLLFYSLLYFFLNNRLPDEVGFFYYRYNTFVPVEIDEEKLNKFRAMISLDIKKMTSGEGYEPTPSAKSCKYCNYLIGCEKGQEAKAKRARPSKIKDLEGEGLITFSF